MDAIEVLNELLSRLDNVSDDRGLDASYDFNCGVSRAEEVTREYRDELLRN